MRTCGHLSHVCLSFYPNAENQKLLESLAMMRAASNKLSFQAETTSCGSSLKKSRRQKNFFRSKLLPNAL